MTPQQFIAKWQRASQLSERSACQQHFLDLCELLGQPKPAEADPEGAWYTFERGVSKTDGGKGWADVWMRGHFGWEYKGKHANLKAAYSQLQQYREALENPPLLVVCDLNQFEIHTNFTGTAKQVHVFDLAGLADPHNLDVLRRAFTNPESLRPGLTSESVTQQAAEQFGLLADSLRIRGIAAPEAAHFLMKLMFSFFAEDVGLLPAQLVTRVFQSSKADPVRLARRLGNLFAAMQSGGDFGADAILHFNGGLFADAQVIALRAGEIESLLRIAQYDWSQVEPSIFGTLFERTLDPAKRSQIGAHYTGRRDIETLLEPVVMAPLRREWNAIREKCDALWEKRSAAAVSSRRTARKGKTQQTLERLLLDFVARLSEVHILDPACGSGNFLYVAVHLLLDLEKEVITYGAARGVGMIPHVRPTQLAGIEINPYAQQLAQVVIWIGYLQWMHHNGFNPPRDPVLEPIESIRLMDAILDLSDPEHPKEPEWPKADFIVGNPPFLGGKLLRTNLGDAYVDSLFAMWDKRVPREADLCCYWFEKARRQIELGLCRRAGLLATQGIRGGANRKVVERVKQTGDIFFAVSDREWVLDGAAVHVSMIGFDNGAEKSRIVDDVEVPAIYSNLSSLIDTTKARRIGANVGLCFMGDTKGGSFDINEATAVQFLHAPNAHGRPNSDVVIPWINGLDLTRRLRRMWIVDFGTSMSLEEATHYEGPFSHVERAVRPARSRNKREAYRDKWWRHVESRPAMRTAIAGVSRFVVTTTVSKHRVFFWLEPPTLPDHQLIVFASEKEEFFGILQCRVHEIWSRAQGTQLREYESGFRYTPTSTFETFPFPAMTEVQREEIAAAASELDRLRQNWLNPPEWTREEVLEFPGSADGPWARYVCEPDARGIGTVRYPRIVPRDAECAKQLAKRTLTNLYNQRPAWLDLAHRRLDEAVLAAYGWPADISDDYLLAKLLALNLERAQ